MHIFLTARISSGYVVWEPRVPCEALDNLRTLARAGLTGELVSEVEEGCKCLRYFRFPPFALAHLTMEDLALIPPPTAAG